MIEIITSEGISLDLSPDYEFSMELESPIFSSDTIPAAFSTQIAFQPTEKNRDVFQYIEAMMLPPKVTQLDATMFFSGVPFMSGHLEYEGIEDGDLNYTFTGIPLSDRFDGKIWESPIVFGGLTYLSRRAVMEAYIGGLFDSVYPVVMIDQAFTETQDSAEDNPRKYINYPCVATDRDIVEVPAINLIRVLTPIMTIISIDRDIRLDLNSFAIVGQYRRSAKKEAFSQEDGAEVDFATYLPDVSYLDLIKVICGLYCASIFQDGRQLRMIALDDVLDGDNIVDIDEKVADAFSSETESAQRYKIGYSGNVSNTYNKENLEADIADGDVVNYSGSLYEMMNYNPYRERPFPADAKYHSIRNAGIDHIYSEKIYTLSEIYTDFFLIDSIQHRHEDFESGTADDVHEVRIGAAPVKCVPIKFTRYDASGGYETPSTETVIGPVVTIPESADRGSDLLLGVYGQGQLCDVGTVIDSSDHSDAVVNGRSGQVLSLSPADLYNSHHRRFAEWLATDRQVVTVGLSLSVVDLSGWRLFNRFAFRGRLWLCKKLTVTFLSGSDRLEAEGEFIAL